jgi:hypothetical protein
MRKHSTLKKIFLLAIFAIFNLMVNGCSTDPYLFEKIEAQIDPKVHELPLTKGDHIYIFKKDGSIIKLIVTNIDSINIHGKRVVKFGENPVEQSVIVDRTDISRITKIQLTEKQGDTTEELVLGGVTAFMYVASAIYGLAYILGAL